MNAAVASDVAAVVAPWTDRLVWIPTRTALANLVPAPVTPCLHSGDDVWRKVTDESVMLNGPW